MFLEVVVFSMFQHEQAVFFQQVVVKNKVGQGLKLFESVRRVGKDKVEPFAAALYVSEYIAADRQAFIGLEFFHYLADESVMVAVFLYADYLSQPLDTSSMLMLPVPANKSSARTPSSKSM